MTDDHQKEGPQNPVVSGVPGVSPSGRPDRRLKVLLVALALLLPVAADLARPPRNQLSARLLLGGIHLYQATLSPRMGTVIRCRFQPTCSHYGEGAIRKYGAWTGSWKTLWRILRCGPWTPAGTVDPP